MPLNSTSSCYTIQASLSAKCLCVCLCLCTWAHSNSKSSHVTRVGDDDAHACYKTLSAGPCYSTEAVEPDCALEMPLVGQRSGERRLLYHLRAGEVTCLFSLPSQEGLSEPQVVVQESEIIRKQGARGPGGKLWLGGREPGFLGQKQLPASQPEERAFPRLVPWASHTTTGFSPLPVKGGSISGPQKGLCKAIPASADSCPQLKLSIAESS